MLEILRGNYTPLLTVRPAPEVAGGGAEEPKRSAWGKPASWAIVVLGLACCALLAWNVSLLGGKSTPPVAVSALWRQSFQPGRETDLIVADSILSFYTDLVRHPVALQDYLSRRYLVDDVASEKDPERRRLMRVLMTRRYTSLADAEAVRRITRLSTLDQRRVSLHFARDDSTQRLQVSNLIVVGSKRSNPWAELFEPQLNFRLQFDPETGKSLVENMRQGADESKTYRVMCGIADVQESLAVVAYLPNLQHTGEVLLLAGSGMSGTEAALEQFISPEAFRRIQDALP